MKVHCKPCKREWDSPDDLMGPARCKCRQYGEEGPLPKEPLAMNVVVLPSKQFLGVDFYNHDSGVIVQVNAGETVITVCNNGKETEYKFPHPYAQAQG